MGRNTQWHSEMFTVALIVGRTGVRALAAWLSANTHVKDLTAKSSWYLKLDSRATLFLWKNYSRKKYPFSAQKPNLWTMLFKAPCLARWKTLLSFELAEVAWNCFLSSRRDTWGTDLPQLDELPWCEPSCKSPLWVRIRLLGETQLDRTRDVSTAVSCCPWCQAKSLRKGDGREWEMLTAPFLQSVA